MKKTDREDIFGNQADLLKSIGAEKLNLRKLGVAISLGKEKKTHLSKLSRRKIAVYKTRISQKNILVEVAE
jgi:ribosomal protein L29